MKKAGSSLGATQFILTMGIAILVCLIAFVTINLAPSPRSPVTLEKHEAISKERSMEKADSAGEINEAMSFVQASLKAEASRPESSLFEFAPGTEENYKKLILPYMKQHCHECHDAKKAKAGLRVDTLSTRFISEPDENWLEVMDAINLGDMPPPDEVEAHELPDSKVSFQVVKWIAAQLSYAEKAARAAGGQIPMRRLNKDEFANTVSDLLHIDRQIMRTIAEDLPGDGKAEGFDRLGVALFFDQTQLDSTLRVAARIADLAIVDPSQKQIFNKQRYEVEGDRRSRNSFRKGPIPEMVDSPFGKKFKVKNGEKFHEVISDGVIFRHHGQYGGREKVDGQPHGRIGEMDVKETVVEDGYYRIKFRAAAERGDRNAPVKVTAMYNRTMPTQTHQSVVIDAPLNRPQVYEMVMFLKAGQPGQKRKMAIGYNHWQYIVSSDVKNKLFVEIQRSVKAVRLAKQSGDKKQIAEAEAALADVNRRKQAWQGPYWVINKKRAGQKPPRLYMDWVEIEGPIKKDWPPKSHQAIFFDGGSDKERSANVRYARQIVERLLPKAYRRPVAAEEVGQVTELIVKEMNAGAPFSEAIKIGLQRMLVSPAFLFIKEPSANGSRQLNAYELATRLSYFLWSSMPDDQLTNLARQGKLRRPEVLRAQIKRMIADPKAREFALNFAGQWLQVRDFGTIKPGERAYPEYDDKLESSSREEAYAFFEEILRKNLAITNFLDSDFLMIDERLAAFYGIEGVKGDHFRRVAIRPEHHRGGVFGMAGLMTLLADGTRTLPVRRATWVLEHMLNDPPPPPPPNAGEIQPNTKGKKLTVRQRLEKHRDEPTCASCHETLDPYGIALENYDAIGKWRERQNGEGFRGKNRPTLDVSGKLQSGRTFDSLATFKQALLAEKDKFAKAFAERMMTYALGRPVGYTDRKIIDRYVSDLKRDDYRIHRLIESIVLSDVFQTK